MREQDLTRKGIAMDKRSAVRKWLLGENRVGRAEVLGHRGTQYFRYDASHRLHRGIDPSKLIKNLGILLLAALLIVGGFLQLAGVVIPGVPIILAMIVIAAGILIVLDR